MRPPRHYYLTTLPAVGELGSVSPIGLADLLEHVADCPSWRELLETLIMLDDLLQRESFLAGETEEVEPSVLTIPQARGEATLPESFIPESAEEGSSTLATDQLWERYFRHVHHVAQRHQCQFLGQWVAFELALRNALVAARARRLGLAEGPYQVALDLAVVDEDLAPIVQQWEASDTPLSGLREIIRARWAWIDRHEAWFSFSVDELLAYTGRVLLLDQWRRTQERDEAVA